MDDREARSRYGFRLGNPKSFRNLTVYPIFYDGPEPGFISLKEALSSGRLKIKEVSEEGTVSRLRVENRGDSPVLLLDGEELSGCRQNRALEISTIVPAQKEMVISVKCTESGRWSYSSRVMTESGTVMPCQLRGTKSISFLESLETRGRPEADQGKIWDGVRSYARRAGFNPKNEALLEIFRHKEGELKAVVDALPCEEGQKGIIAAINGAVVGMDFVASASVYRDLHPKLIRSYALDALLEKKKNMAPPRKEDAYDFLVQTTLCSRLTLDSNDRLQSIGFKGNGLVGTLLTYEGRPAHLSFLRTSD